MNGTVDFLLQYGYLVLFSVVLAEQIGLPIPATPMLLAAGALAGTHRMSLLAIMIFSVSACLVGDLLWFVLGTRRGSGILRLLCKISLEPDSCVKETEVSYARYGSASLLFAKFVPGLSTIAPPMAGIFKLPLWRFMMLDTAGSAIWSGFFVFTGWLFHSQMEKLVMRFSYLGGWLLAGLLSALGAYTAYKYFQRHRVLRGLRIDRITPSELKDRMDDGAVVTIVDLRKSLEWGSGKIPGALQMHFSQIETEIPKEGGGEIILYCSCPNEVTAARYALQLRRQGVGKVRPLKGGFELWRELGYPIEFNDDSALTGAHPEKELFPLLPVVEK